MTLQEVSSFLQASGSSPGRNIRKKCPPLLRDIVYQLRLAFGTQDNFPNVFDTVGQRLF
jgi:hypothetical protein